MYMISFCSSHAIERGSSFASPWLLSVNGDIHSSVIPSLSESDRSNLAMPPWLPHHESLPTATWMMSLQSWISAG